MVQVRLPARRERQVLTRVVDLGRAVRVPLARLLAITRGEGPSGSSSHQASGHATARRARFEQWFAQYRVPLLDYLYGMTRDREWAADLVQETFLHAYAAADDHDAITYPRAWLYRIATNAALTALHRRKRFTWLPLAVVEPPPGADSSDQWTRPELPDLPDHDFVVDMAERDAVWKTLAELPPRWRSVLLLQATGGFEVREIAAQLGLSEANVRKILFRAKERFRALHAQQEASGPPISPAKGGPR